jgi:Fe-S-cluster containining protein
MELETDIQKIQRLAKEREDANWAFRCFLKRSDLSIGRIDRTVRDLYREVLSEIDCTKCANCCKTVSPVLKPADIRRLANQLALSVDQFRFRFLTEAPEKEGPVFKNRPCSFLKDNLCTVYDHRPGDCRSYPHLHKKEFVFSVNQAFSNCFVCPIVFNVYEGLKQELWRHRPR